MNPCPFCTVPPDDILAETSLCFALYDRFPVTPHHALLIPRRHVTSFATLTEKEWTELHGLACEVQRRIREDDTSVTGFNLGINDGETAGQTVPHLHVHLLPRRVGDVPNPVGGVRWVFGEKADYLKTEPRMHTPARRAALRPGDRH